MGSSRLRILRVKPPYERLLGMRNGFPRLGLAWLAAMLRVHGQHVDFVVFGETEETIEEFCQIGRASELSPHLVALRRGRDIVWHGNGRDALIVTDGRD